MTRRERARQLRIASTRACLTNDEFISGMMASGISADLAQFIWEALLPYYFEPLRPDPSDRIYDDMKIDPDDISDLALEYERRFGVRLEGNPIPCPSDPTLIELGLALQRASVI